MLPAMAPRSGRAQSAMMNTVARPKRRMRKGAASAMAIIDSCETPVTIAVVRNGVPSWIEKFWAIRRLIGALPKWKISSVNASRIRPREPAITE
jgi:hypothetical protein